MWVLPRRVGGHQRGCLQGRVVLLALTLWSGCAPKVAPADSFVAAIAAADRVWEDRAASGGLEVSERAYTVLLAERPDSPDVRWRLARAALSRRLIDGDNAAMWHEIGREHALRCLSADVGIVEGIARTGDRLLPEMVRAAVVPPECAALAAAHVVGLARARGLGSALDLEDAVALLAAPAPAGGVERAWQRWAAGTLATDVVASRAALREAVQLAPGVLFFREAAVRAFPDLDGVLPPATPDPAWALENRRVP